MLMKTKIVIVTDAWEPQINGVVTTIKSTKKEIEKNGVEVIIISSNDDRFKTFQAPKYPGVEMALNPWKVKELLDKEARDSYIHIATEGPLGVFAILYCEKYDIPFTTSYHTKTPEFLKMIWHVPECFGYSYMRWLHKNACKVLVTTKTIKKLLEDKNLHHDLVVWNRGVDTELFDPKHRTSTKRDQKILLSVGRVSKEKNLLKFLELKIPNTTKVVVGDGPEKSQYERMFPDTKFVGFKTGQQLVDFYANADVFVFPSLWDTFGLVQIEAAACGTPIASFDSSETSKDIIVNGVNSWASDSLEESIERCLSLNRNDIRQHTLENFSLKACTKTFIETVCLPYRF